ncbi:cytochrome P450 4c21-like [Malaya genurostris]|uniref:cytochrome P450 4c21-like n=1 Tax=Malaya genurostris TaxID=325434 RepID=UPI0026F407BB|nr:cytochrome P450 4c21-like [Malaya genurostris]
MIGLLLVLILIVSVVQFVRFRRATSFARNLPSVEPCYPIIGNALLFLGQSDEKRFLNVIRASSNPAKLFKLWIGFVPVVCTNDPDTVQKILNHPDCMDKPYFYDFFKLDFGLITARYDIWKGQRKALNPTFNRKLIDGFITIFATCSQNLVERLTDHESVRLTPFLQKCTLEMICATTIGTDINRQQGVENLSRKVDEIFHLVSRRILSIFAHSDRFYRLTKNYGVEEGLRNEVLFYGNQIVRQVKTQKQTEPSSAENRNDDKIRKPQIFIDQLLNSQSGKKFDEIEIIHNMYTIIVAGSGTTETQMSLIALLLAIYPDMQEKVYEEIMTVFPGNSDPSITPDSIKQLQYLDMFVKECSRLFPVVPHILRTPIKDVDLDGLIVPKGAFLCISIFNIHRRKDVWGPNADKFDPENFSPECIEGRHPFAFLPFSGGPRNCIGARYAMVALKIMTIYLVRTFKIRTKARFEDLSFKYDVLLKLSTEPEITLERRTTSVQNHGGN